VPESSGKRFAFLTIKPTAMQIKRVSIGFSVAKKVSNISLSKIFINEDIVSPK
jgi:hypothetical protein